MKKFLFISWSPKKWNTDRLLLSIFDQLQWDKEMLLLREKKIHHCLWCDFCEKGNGCAVKDDMQDIMQKLEQADVIILWSPNYFANVSGITKNFIDRTAPLLYSRALEGKKIFLVMPWTSIDEKNEKYLLQWTHGFIKYQGMALLWAYGWCTADSKATEQKTEYIAKQILKRLAE